MTKVRGLSCVWMAGMLLGSAPALAQVACLDGANSVPCINPPNTELFNIFNSAPVTNAGKVFISLQTVNDGATVTNSGFVGNDLQTAGTARR